MAEAHSAVAFSFSVTHDGVDVNVNRDAIKAVFNSGVRTWKRKVARFKNRVANGIYPARPSSWLYIVALLTVVSLCGKDPSWGIISRLEVYLRESREYVPPYDRITASLLFSVMLWLAGIAAIKYFLLFMLRYKGWMYEPHGRMSVSSKVWLGIMKLLRTRYYRLYGYQGSLPRLPLPPVKDTVRRFMRSVKPFLKKEDYEKMDALSKQFLNSIANRLQFYLMLKSWWSSNYVSDWWEDYVYLAGRSPIMVNSNFYGLETIMVKPLSPIQSARAANITFLLLKFMRLIDREELKPILLNNTVPLCSLQYERLFSTTRIPGVEKDRLQHIRDSRHIVVYHRGRFFKVFVYSNGRWLLPCELQILFQNILDDKAEPLGGEERLPALTAADRRTWAKTRSIHFARGPNRQSLEAIEKAIFFAVLEEKEYDYDPEDETKLDTYAKAMLAGECHDRWFDKSFTMVFARNGRIGFNAEHSWGDAPIMAHMWEYVISLELEPDKLKDSKVKGLVGYDESGNCLGTPRENLPIPVRLKWEINDDLRETISNSLTAAIPIRDDVDLHLIVHKRFGKGVMKKAKVSPDAFIQLALQLAYLRDQQNFCLTYEASMTRMYREGRTETVRSCSCESAEFAHAMDNPDLSKEEKIEKLRSAAAYHTNLTRDAMAGKGVDRHLFCLYVVSKYLGVESPFLKEVLSEPWRLSTSQTPHQQTDLFNITLFPNHLCAGGGFGPVADDGYGVSYIIAGDDCIFFHISCKHSCPDTNSKRFSDRIVQALDDIKKLI